MSLLIEAQIIQTLKEEVVPAMGCTEPVAIALCVAKARELANIAPHESHALKSINVTVSPNIFKNGLAVGIPGTTDVGLFIASALGFAGCHSKDSLEVFEAIDQHSREAAYALIDAYKVTVAAADTTDKIWIEAIVTTESGYGKAIIRHRHAQFVHLENQDGIQLHETAAASVAEAPTNPLMEVPILELIRTISEMDATPLLWMLDGLKMNQHIAAEGTLRKHGMGVGYALNQKIESGILGRDVMNKAMALTASASDCRMAGLSLPVMSSNGSGNNGLTALLPIVAYAEIYPTSDEQLAKAAAMSHIVNSVVKNAIGRLSAICGCGVAAGTGASVALAWLMGASEAQLEGVIQNMIANTTGMVCDGAKVGCALKLATSASAAVQSAVLAVSDCIVPAGNGIVAKTADKTIENLGILSKEAMPKVDTVLLKIMMQYN
jgi:L-cysteine desulfidase